MTSFYIFFALLAACIAVFDFLFFRIPNIIVFLMLAAFILKTLIFHDVSFPYTPFIAGAVSLTIGYFAFLYKFMGAGDSKFLSVAAMWASQVDVLGFVFVVCVLGGGLALIYSRYGEWVLWVRAGAIKFLVKILGDKNFLYIFGKDSLNILNKMSEGTDYQAQRMVPYGVPTFFGCCFITTTKILG